MSEPEDNRKGRAPAILTYERVGNIEVALVRMDGKMDHMAEKLDDMKTLHVDHEVRIKALELSQAAINAASSATSGTWVYVVGLALVIPGTITAIISLLRFFGGGA